MEKLIPYLEDITVHGQTVVAHICPNCDSILDPKTDKICPACSREIDYDSMP